MDENNANDGIRMFAKGGITAAIAINSGALIGTLSRLPDLTSVVDPARIGTAILTWALGVGFGTLCWIAAHSAASAYANGKDKSEIWAGIIGYASAIASICLFVFGFWQISQGLA